MIYAFFYRSTLTKPRAINQHQLLALTNSIKPKHHHRIAIASNSSSSSSSGFSFSASSIFCCCCCCLISVGASRLCQTCVSVCVNNASWVFPSCLVNVVLIIQSSSSRVGSRQLRETRPDFLVSRSAAADDPYMLSMLSALRLKSAAAGFGGKIVENVNGLGGLNGGNWLNCGRDSCSD